jgi:phosphoglycolate phosphatase-like HAD superfamily hydrolase
MEAYYHIYNTCLQELGVSLPAEEQRRIIDENWGSSHRVILMALLKAAKQSGHLDKPVNINTLQQTFEDVSLEDFAELIKPVPGAVEMLGRLASRYTLALNTAADPEVLFGRVMPKLNMHEPTKLFSGGVRTAINLTDERLAKPDPHTVLGLMKDNNVKPGQTAMIGDSSSDVFCAMGAGIEDIAVPLTGKMTREDAAEFDVVVIPDVTYVEQLLGGVGLGGYSEYASSFSGTLRL